jgi:preprotein translocase subunit SecD
MPEALQNPFVVWLLLTAVWSAVAYGAIRLELRTRAVLYGAFLIACGVAIWPPYARGEEPGKIRLGLDLKGGIHLVLRVKTDEALVATVDDAVQTSRDQAQRKGIVFSAVERKDPTTFAVTGVEPARVKDMRDLLRDLFRGAEWEVREPGEGRFEVGMTDFKVRDIRAATVREAMRTLERRVNQLGVAEPVIAQQGAQGDQILVQLPGVKDPESAKRVIKTTAQLSLKLVENEGPTRESLLQNSLGAVPANMEVVPGQGETPGQPVFYLVRHEAVITGRDLKNARVGVDENNQPNIHFSLNPAGSDKFRRETGRNVGRRLAIILDGNVYSAPVIQNQISSEGQIQGRFTTQEADELAKVLKAGALPASLEYLHQLNVGASLGRDSIRSGVAASVAAMAMIGVFMLLYYRFSGVNAVVALAANLLILLGAMAYTQATLTLPGIAGIILTVGVGVDTNVLVFERIREELRNGKTVRAAVQNGFERVWITILDTHATALIAAAFLFQFGTGPIKGFAVTLVMGLVANVFASYFVSKFLFEWVLGKGQVQQLSI